MNSSAFVHKTAKFNPAEAQELPQAPSPYAHVAGMRQVEEQATNLSPSHLHLQVLASSQHLLENLRQQSGLPVLAASLCSVRNSGSRQKRAVASSSYWSSNSAPTTPGNSLLRLVCGQPHTVLVLKMI